MNEIAQTGLPEDITGFSQKKKILKQRADALAIKPEKKEEDESIEIVEFQLAHEKYGIESIFVREVYPLKDLTPVPCTPSFVAGLINVRGEILSVIDIKKFFNLPEEGLTDKSKVIIICNDRIEFGILADEIVGVDLILIRKLQSTIPTLTGIRAKYLKGVTAGQIVVLDAEKILSDKKIIIHEEV